MTLTEILHTIQDDKEKGLVNIDDWKWADADHLKTMGFDFDGDYVMSMKDPAIKVYKKKSPQGEIFMVEAEKQQSKAFQQFDQVVEFFDHYSQPEIDKERD